MARRKPNWLQKVNFITNYLLSDCSADGLLYVEAARPTAYKTLLVFLAIDLQDLVKEFARPKGLRSKRHGRKGRRGGRKLKGLPDASEFTAKRVPGQADFAQRKYGTATRVIYETTDAWDRVAWTAALLDMSADLFYDSIIGVIDSGQTNCPVTSRARRSVYNSLAGGVGPVYQPYNMNILNYSVGVFTPNGFGFGLPDKKMAVCFAISFAFRTAPCRVSVQMRSGNNEGKVYFRTPYYDIDEGDTLDIIEEFSVLDEDYIVWEISCLDAFVTITKSDCFCQQIGDFE